mgnify:FL=1
MGFILISLIFLIGFTSYFLGSLRAKNLRASNHKNLKSLSHYYGYYVALWAVVPALLILLMITSFKSLFIEQYVLSDFIALGSYTETELSLLFTQIENTALGIKLFDENTILIDDAVNKLNYINKTIENLTYVTVLGFSGLLVLYSLFNINYKLNSRKIVEKFLLVLYFTCSLVAIMTTVGIIFSLLYETLRFFSQVPITDFLFGLNWSPQRVFVREAGDLDTRDLANAFGAVPLFAGTFLIALIAMCVSVPVGLFTAIYMAEYASPKVRDWAKPIIEILAGIPTVVYGFFAALTVAPLVRDIGQGAGLTVSSESALAAGFVMGIMIIPFISSLSDDVIKSVPQSLREGSYAMGATKRETIVKVLLPAALPGIVGSFLLAVSRAIGETMIVVMAAGLNAKLTANPLDAATTITTQIVVILIGDQEFDSPKTQSAFALGLTLFVVTLALNFIALQVVKKYTERYD